MKNIIKGFIIILITLFIIFLYAKLSYRENTMRPNIGKEVKINKVTYIITGIDIINNTYILNHELKVERKWVE